MNANQPGVQNRDEAPESLGEEVGRDIEQIRRMGEERLEDLREIGGQIRQRVQDEIKTRPFVALGVAFGTGVLVSSLMQSRLARLAILAAGGYAAREMFGERLMDVLGSHEEEESRPRPKRERKSESNR